MAIQIAIDLGTANSLIILKGKGLVIQEPTVIAYSLKENKVVAIGLEAKEMLGKTPKELIVRRPLKQGVIASYKLTESFISNLIQNCLGRIRFSSVEAIVSVPAGLTSVEQRAVTEAVNSAGVSKVYLLPEPMAAAIGVGMPIGTSSGNMIINMGGGTAEIAVISMNGLVEYTSKRLSGDAINEAIQVFIRKKYNLIVGENMAERIKMQIGSAIERTGAPKMQIRGNDNINGLPRSIFLDSNELIEPIRKIIDEIIVSVKIVLEKTPPELTADIIDRGVVLSGGTSLIFGMDELFTQALNVPAHVVENPLTAVVEGAAFALENIDEFRMCLKG